MLLGIDVGSTGMKAALYTLEGQRVGSAYREYSIQYGTDGSATLDPEIWMHSFQACMQELSQQCCLKLVRAIGISGANAMVLTNRKFEPVFPVIMQLDKRGRETTAVIAEEFGKDWIFRTTGNRIASGYQWGPTLKYLQIHAPDRFSTVGMIFNPTSYFVKYLTGAYTMDRTRAATTMLYNVQNDMWDSTLWDYMGLSRAEKPRLLSCAELAGYTHNVGGLPDGIPVAAGGIDTICAMMGLTGGNAEDVIILGSVGRIAASVVTLDDHFLNTVSWDGRCKISMTPVNNAGTALKWLKNLLFQTGKIDYSEMGRMAEAIPSGSEGLVFLPYLNGASCPHWDDEIRGAFLGMESYHTPSHMIRAVLEGVALSLAENQTILGTCGCNVTRPLYIGGGGAKSGLWCQILSDVLDRELLLPNQTETETMGAAILGGRSAGILDQTKKLSWNIIQKHFMPIREHVVQFQSIKERFLSAEQFLMRWGKNHFI